MHRALIYDASPGLGGALTSAQALIEVLDAAGWAVHVAATRVDEWARAVPGRVSPVSPQAFGRVHGLGYAARELHRATALAEIARRWRPTVILANNAPTTNAAAYFVGGAQGVPVVQYLRVGPGPSRLGGRLVRGAAAVFTVGEVATAWAIGAGVRPVPIAEGLGARQWPAQKRAGARRFLWAASPLPWKGLSLLRAAWPQMALRPALDVCAPTLPSHAAPRRGPTEWRFHGPQALGSVRQGCGVFVHTALRPEPFGRSVLEAMAAGLCPVVPDEGGPARLVTHGVNGLRYPARSATGLAAALSQLAAQPAMGEALGAAARASAEGYRAAGIYAPLVEALAG